MKKYLLLVAVLTVMATGVVGQVPDTVYQRAENYFYMEWYDETDEFNQYDSIYTHMICLNEAGNYYAYSDDPTRSYVGKNYYTDRPIRVVRRFRLPAYLTESRKARRRRPSPE